MEKNCLKQIHVIPFDLGAVLYNKLNVDNTKNLEFIEMFCDELETSLGLLGMSLTRCYKISEKDKTVRSIEFLDNDMADQALCDIEVCENVHCYILSMGIGVFVFADLNCLATDYEKNDKKRSVFLLSNYQKKVTQAALLYEIEGNEYIRRIRDKMLIVREECWRLVKKGEKRKKIEVVRPFSSNADYKSKGLSYVLTAYLFCKKDFENKTEKDREKCIVQLNNLLYSSIFADIGDRSKWDEIEKNLQEEIPEKEVSVKASNAELYFSWSAVAFAGDSEIKNFADIKNNKVLATLMRVETYIQARWSVADYSMDNVNKYNKCNMESIQNMAGIVEFYQAEIDNAISANMQTLHRNILQKVIDTSNVKDVYQSVLRQIETQIKIKEAHYRDRNVKSKLIVDIFLAMFTAASLYKTVIDIIAQNFKWYNFLFLGIAILLSVGAVYVNYKKR